MSLSRIKELFFTSLHNDTSSYSSGAVSSTKLPYFGLSDTDKLIINLSSENISEHLVIEENTLFSPNIFLDSDNKEKYGHISLEAPCFNLIYRDKVCHLLKINRLTFDSIMSLKGPLELKKILISKCIGEVDLYFFDYLPVIPLGYRKYEIDENNQMQMDSINNQYLKILKINNDLYDAIREDKEKIIIDYLSALLQLAVNNLISNGIYNRPFCLENNIRCRSILDIIGLMPEDIVE